MGEYEKMFIISMIHLAAVLFLFGLIGGFVLIPFRHHLSFPFFIAPQVGIFVGIAGTAFCYTFLNMPISTAFNVTTIGAILLTIFALAHNKIRINIFREILVPLIASIVLISMINYVCNSATFIAHDFSLTYLDGTDHLGYAHVADWLTMHLSAVIPQLDQNFPYQSWPAVVFKIDPRFGSFFYLAIVEHIYQLDGMFSYDIACALLLSAACMGLSGLFARSKLTYMLLLLVILTSSFFSYGMSGYLGKMIGYTSILFLIGLFLVSEKFSSWQVLFLSCLAVVCASVYPAIAIVVMFGMFYIVYGFSSFIIEKGRINLFVNSDAYQKLVLFLLILSMIIFSTGIIARSIQNIGSIRVFDVQWIKILMGYLGPDRTADDFLYSDIRGHLKHYIFNVELIIMCILPIIAYYRKNTVALTLCMLPLIMMLIFFNLNQKWILYQLTGFTYPLQAIGLLCLYDNEKKTNSFCKRFSFLLLNVLIIFNLLSFSGAANKYSSFNYVSSKFLKHEMDQLQELIKDQKVTVDIDNPMYTIPLLVELGKNPYIDIHWTDGSWHATFAYNPLWSMPKQVKTPYIIRLKTDKRLLPAGCTAIFYTQQYTLLRCR
jgi:hypothetical protein